jgi:hypothetical protein
MKSVPGDHSDFFNGIKIRLQAASRCEGVQERKSDWILDQMEAISAVTSGPQTPGAGPAVLLPDAVLPRSLAIGVSLCRLVWKRLLTSGPDRSAAVAAMA